MNIVLTCLHNFQDYILINIEQLLRLGHKSIYVITDLKLCKYFTHFDATIVHIIPSESLEETYNYNSNSKMDKCFLDGFWTLTSSRFFYIYAFMKKYSVTDVIHIENDVLIYYNCNILSSKLDKDFMYIPFDCYERNIASIIYIPNHALFKQVLDHYDFNKNDMYNFAGIQEKTGLLHNFPIFISDITQNDEYQYVTKNFDKFGYIFDAAAMGQYLGGVDPRNIPGDSTGFVNETCIIKYNNYKFGWISGRDNVERPYLLIHDKYIPVFNLHIHCKKLNKFVNF